MAELVDAADSKSVFERSGSSSLPRGTNTMRKGLDYQGLFFVWRKFGVMGSSAMSLPFWSVDVVSAFAASTSCGVSSCINAKARRRGASLCCHLPGLVRGGTVAHNPPAKALRPNISNTSCEEKTSCPRGLVVLPLPRA